MGKDHLGDPNMDGMLILKRTLKKHDRRVWTKFIWYRIRTSAGLL
jgi:hypothetical protein